MNGIKSELSVAGFIFTYVQKYFYNIYLGNKNIIKNLRNGYSTYKADDTNLIRASFLSLDLFTITFKNGWLGSQVVSVLDSGAEGPGFKSQPRRCRVTDLGKLFTPIVPCSPSSKIGSSITFCCVYSFQGHFLFSRSNNLQNDRFRGIFCSQSHIVLFNAA